MATPGLWRRCPCSDLQLERTRKCPLLPRNLRAPWWLRDLPPTPNCLDLVTGHTAQRQGDGPNVPRCPQQPPVPPKMPYLAEALLDPLGFRVTGGHGAADPAQVVPGIVHRPQGSRWKVRAAGAPTPAPSCHLGHQADMEESFQTTGARARGSQAFGSPTASVSPGVPSTLTCPP